MASKWRLITQQRGTSLVCLNQYNVYTKSRYFPTRCYCRQSRNIFHQEHNTKIMMYTSSRAVSLLRPSLLCSFNKFNSLPCRTFLGFPNMPEALKGKRKEFSERKLLGFSMEQMYDVVANVDDYKYFVPWCRNSKIIETKPGHLRAILEVGFPPLIERYSSILTVAKPNLVKSECIDGEMFNYMRAIWRFSRGIPGRDDTCTLDFHIAFEFKSALHSHLSSMFFDEVVKKMVTAFEKRCESIHGCSIPSKTALKRKRRLGIRRPVESR